jgi:hypothetical protein
VGLAVGLLTCAGSCVVGLLVVGVSSQLGDAKPGALPSTAVGVEQFRQALARVRANVPEPSAVTETPCPDAEMLRAARVAVTSGSQGEARLRARWVSYETLADFVDKGQTRLERPRPSILPNREELGFDPVPATGPDDWQWLEDGVLPEVFHPNLYEGSYLEDELRRTIAEVLANRYLAVLRASNRAMPRILKAGVQLDVLDRRRELRSGQSFTPGVFQGAILVMDIGAASVVCQATLEARSSATIVYRNRTSLGLMRQQPSKELRSDFQDRFHEAARASLGRISKLLDSPW